MTLRTTLLAVCMVAVPGVALFSHRVPADVRSATRGAVTNAIAWCRDAVMPRGPVASQPAEPAAFADAADAGPVAGALPTTPPTETPEATLTRLGATAVECRPLPGPHGGHTASCAVTLDAEGHLLRMFHGAGGDREAALAALAAEVADWRNRFTTAGRREHPLSSAGHP